MVYNDLSLQSGNNDYPYLRKEQPLRIPREFCLLTGLLYQLPEWYPEEQ